MPLPPRWIEAGSGARALVLLHGVSGSAEVWRPLLAPLAAAGWRVLAWDMPGYGRSAPLDEVGFGSWSESLAAMLDAAGLGRCVLVGHSLGGMIALEAAARMPERFDALVLACTTPSFGATSGAAQQAFLERRLGPLDRGGSMAALAHELIPAMAAVGADAPLLATHQAVMAALAPDSYRAAVGALVGFDRRRSLASISVPTLCLAGGADTVAQPGVMRAMAGRIPAARYVCIEARGHLAPFEAPAAFVAAVCAFADDACAGVARPSGA